MWMKTEGQKTSYFNIESGACSVSYDLNFINISSQSWSESTKIWWRNSAK